MHTYAFLKPVYSISCIYSFILWFLIITTVPTKEFAIFRKFKKKLVISKKIGYNPIALQPEFHALIPKPAVLTFFLLSIYFIFVTISEEIKITTVFNSKIDILPVKKFGKNILFALQFCSTI
jgi:hypothetical protein